MIDLPDGSVLIGPNENGEADGELQFGQVIRANDSYLFASAPGDLKLEAITIWNVDYFASVLYMQRLLDPSGNSDTPFGCSIAATDDLLVVGASGDNPQVFGAGDVTGNGTVNIDDLLNVIGQFGEDCASLGGCTADIDGDSDVDIDDLLLVIAAFGPC